MDTRKIIIVDSASNQKVVVNTDATTFGELKRAARAAGINYEGKDWLEGITKSSPVSDDSLLPTNVQYKGTTTNNLVYMLTNTNTKIKSGADRKALYSDIKKYNLAEDIKRTFGKNFTQVSNDDLAKFINKASSNESATCINNWKNKYDTLVNATAVYIASIPKDILNEAMKKANDITLNILEDVDFTDEELKSMFKD